MLLQLEVTRKAPIMPTSSPSHATAPANDLPVRGPKLDATSLDRERASLSHIQSLRQFAQYVNNSSRRDPASDQPEAHSPRKGPPSSQASTDVASVLGLEQVNISAAPSEVSGYVPRRLHPTSSGSLPCRLTQWPDTSAVHQIQLAR